MLITCSCHTVSDARRCWPTWTKIGKTNTSNLPASPSISQHLPTAPATVLPTAASWETTWVSLHHISRPPRVQLEPKKDQEKPKKLKIIQRQEDLRWLAKILFPTKIHLQSSLIPFALSVCIQIIYFYYPDSTLKHNYTSLKPISTSKIKHCNLKSMEIHRKSLWNRGFNGK